MGGVTGRMGTNQHLVRSILAIREQDGIRLAGERILGSGLDGHHEPSCASWRNGTRSTWTWRAPSTVVTATFSSTRAARCSARGSWRWRCRRARPSARETHRGGRARPCASTGCAGTGLRTGSCRTSSLPELRQLKYLIDEGFFSRIPSVRGGSAVGLPGMRDQPAQRPSWNFWQEDGGGIMVDMFCHGAT